MSVLKYHWKMSLSSIFLLLISNLIPSRLENILYIRWTLLNLLGLILWLRVWSILVSTPCVPEKNMYAAFVGWSTLKTISWANLGNRVIQLVYVLNDICSTCSSNTERRCSGPPLIMHLFTSPFNSVRFTSCVLKFH